MISTSNEQKIKEKCDKKSEEFSKEKLSMNSVSNANQNNCINNNNNNKEELEKDKENFENLAKIQKLEEKSNEKHQLDDDYEDECIIIKRDKSEVKFEREKLLKNLKNLSYGLHVSNDILTKMIEKIFIGLALKTNYEELIQLSIDVASSNVTIHPDYAILAGRLCMANIHKNTLSDFSAYVDLVNKNFNKDSTKNLFNKDIVDFVEKNKEKLNATLDYSQDFTYSYFGLRTLISLYLLKSNQQKILERPQQLLMRVSIGINYPNIDKVIESYKCFSQKLYTHATPTLLNSGRHEGQLASCFLQTIASDSIEGIFKTLSDTAVISKYSGGIGISLSHIRSSGQKLRRTNLSSQGIIPMIKVFASCALYVNQGGSSRPGAIALYLEPWHADILDFLDLRKNQGSEERRARNVFTALWIPDLFMKRVENNEKWTLMSHDTSPGLCDAYGEEFEKLYEKYEKEGKGIMQINARDIWNSIIESQIETGTPYMLYKDSINEKSNQKNIGTIRNSNLCAEIVEYCDSKEIAVCNLASLNLPKFVDLEKKEFDFDKLFEVSKLAINNLDLVIDKSFYPTKECEISNKRHRPVGLGVQGLADVFMLLKLPFDCEKAKELNRFIFETIYFASITASCDLAQKFGKYETYEGSPMSKGYLSFDLWKNENPKFEKWNWQELREKVSKYGIRNSLTTTCMPTASTSNILSNNECIEPYTSNIYLRRVLSGEFQIVNSHLIKDLKALNLWNKKMKNAIISNHGSIQSIQSIPEEIREIYRTVWEIPQKALIDMSADRAPFIDQTQSLNIFLSNPTHQQLTSMHFYGWKKGLKTGMYYLRTKPAANALQFSIEKHNSSSSTSLSTSLSLTKNTSLKNSAVEMCKLENGPDSCMMCGS